MQGMSYQARDYASGGQPMRLNTNPLSPTQIDLEPYERKPPAHVDDVRSPTSPSESIRARRIGRSNTAKTYRPEGRGNTWRPGQEPGIDVSQPDAGQVKTDLPQVFEQCDITVVDFSQDDMKRHHLDNHTLGPFLKGARPAWSSCRWINVNGLELGRH